MFTHRITGVVVSPALAATPTGGVLGAPSASAGTHHRHTALGARSQAGRAARPGSSGRPDRPRCARRALRVNR